MILNFLRKPLHFLLIVSLISLNVQDCWADSRSSSDDEDQADFHHRKPPPPEGGAGAASVSRRDEEQIQYKRLEALEGLNIRTLRSSFQGHHLQHAITFYTPRDAEDREWIIDFTDAPTPTWRKIPRFFSYLDEGFFPEQKGKSRGRIAFQTFLTLLLGGPLPLALTPTVSFSTFNTLKIPLNGTGEEVAIWGYLTWQYLTALPQAWQAVEDTTSHFIEPHYLTPGKDQERPAYYRKPFLQHVTEVITGGIAGLSTLLPLAVFLFDAEDIIQSPSSRAYALTCAGPFALMLFDVFFRSGMKSLTHVWEEYYHWKAEPLLAEKKKMMIRRVEDHRKIAARYPRYRGTLFRAMQQHVQALEDRRDHGRMRESLLTAIATELETSTHRWESVQDGIFFHFPLGSLGSEAQGFALHTQGDGYIRGKLTPPQIRYFLVRHLSNLQQGKANAFDKEYELQRILLQIKGRKTCEIRGTPKDTFRAEDLLPRRQQMVLGLSYLMLKKAHGPIQADPDLPPVDGRGNIVLAPTIVTERAPLMGDEEEVPLQVRMTELEKDFQKLAAFQRDLGEEKEGALSSALTNKTADCVVWVGGIGEFFAYQKGISQILAAMNAPLENAVIAGWVVSGFLTVLRGFIDYAYVKETFRSLRPKRILSKEQDLWGLRKVGNTDALARAFFFSLIQSVVQYQFLDVVGPMKYGLMAFNFIRNMAFFYQVFNRISQRSVTDSQTFRPMGKIESESGQQTYTDSMFTQFIESIRRFNAPTTNFLFQHTQEHERAR